jgi:hypothetical protein
MQAIRADGAAVVERKHAVAVECEIDLDVEVDERNVAGRDGDHRVQRRRAGGAHAGVARECRRRDRRAIAAQRQRLVDHDRAVEHAGADAHDVARRCLEDAVRNRGARRGDVGAGVGRIAAADAHVAIERGRGRRCQHDAGQQ